MKLSTMTIRAALALSLGVFAAPLAAQGKSGQHGHGQEHGQAARAHTETHTQTHATSSHVVTRPVHRTTTSTRATPPGWCQGRGNPHNTAANCGYRTDRIYRDRHGVWRDRYGHRLQSGYVYRDRSGTIRDFLGRLLR